MSALMLLPEAIRPELLLAAVPIGFVAGGLAGLLGLGGGLIFSPLFLLLGLEPAQALATSTMAIVPTTLASTHQHLQQGGLPRREFLWIGAGSLGCGLLFSRLGGAISGWVLLGLQCLIYILLAIIVRAHPGGTASDRARHQPGGLGLLGVGSIAGVMGSLLGLGGGVLMVPLLVRLQQLPIVLAIRLSSASVLLSTSVASMVLIAVGRGAPVMGLIVGISAACGASLAASRVEKVPPGALALLLRLLAMGLAVYTGSQAWQSYVGG